MGQLTHRLTIVLAAMALLATACGDGGDDTDAGAPGTTQPPGSATTATTTSAETALPGGELEPCDSPSGFTISAPATWATNDGTVVPRCTQFDPEPFEVPDGTDERVAAITAYVEPTAFATAARPLEGRDEDRAVTTIDGRQAVRLSYESTGEGLYPEGTPLTTYLVDVEPSNGDPATLVLSTIGTPPFDYERNVTVLDRMARTVEVTDPAVDTDPYRIAAYLGGGGGFSVTAATSDGELCLRIPPNGEPVCTQRPDSDQVHTIALSDLAGRVEAGITGAEVWRVELIATDGERHSYLPPTVPGTGLGAYAFPDSVDGFERLELRDLTGSVLREVVPGGA